MADGAHTASRSQSRVRLALTVMLVLALVAAGTAAFLGYRPGDAFGLAGLGSSSRNGTETAGARCVVQTVEVVAAPDVSTAVRAGATTLEDDCLTIRVTPQPTADVVERVTDGERLPAVWVPDSVAWQSEFFLSGVQYRTETAALASSPVLLVGGPAARTSPTWGAALASPDLALPDPLDTTVGAMALVAPRAEGRALGRADADSDQLVVPLAQKYGERRAEGELPDLDLASIGSADRRVVPATERAYLAALDRNVALRPVVPRTGAPLMRFPVVLPGPADRHRRADRPAAGRVGSAPMPAARCSAPPGCATARAAPPREAAAGKSDHVPARADQHTDIDGAAPDLAGG